MRPITLTPPKKWLGDVRYRVPAPKWPSDVAHFAPPCLRRQVAEDGDYVFGWTMDEVDEFIAQVAAERNLPPEPPQAIAGKICAECGRDRPLSAFHRRSASPDGRERLCKRCASAAGRVAREKTAAGGKYAKTKENS